MRTHLVITTIPFLAVAAIADRRADDPAKVIAPLVEGHTIAVARLDMGRLDPAAVADQAVAMDLIEAGERNALRQSLTRKRDLFTKAGGRDLYLLVHLTDLPMQPLTVAVPMAEGADVRGLTAALRESGLLPEPDSAIEPVGGFLAAGHRSSIERLKKIKPAAPSDLAAAFAATGDSAFRLVVLPPADLRRVIEELAPTLPSEVGGGPTSVLTRGVRWLAFGCNAPPQADLRLVVQSPDAGTAKALHETIATGLAAAIKAALAAQQPGQRGDPALLDALEFARAAAALKPTVKGDQLVLTMPDKTFTEVSAQLARLAIGPAARRRSVDNLKQIALACHNFHDVYGRFPANIVDKDGKPLLSWRVAILPFVDQSNIYKEFRFNEPWDSEHNKKLVARMPAVYRRSSSRPDRSRTTYLMPAGKDTALAADSQGLIFRPEKGLVSRDEKKKGVRIADMTDGTSNTILVVDTADERAVPWTKPDDWVPDAADPRKGVVGSTRGGFMAALGDGSVRFIAATITPKTLWNAITRNDGQPLGPDW